MKKTRSCTFKGVTDPRFAKCWNYRERSELWKQLLMEKTGGICGICNKQIFSLYDLHGDHIVPKSCGGSDDWDNIQPTHRFCNISKGNLGFPKRNRLAEVEANYREASWYFKHGWFDDNGKKIPIAISTLICKIDDKKLYARYKQENAEYNAKFKHKRGYDYWEEWLDRVAKAKTIRENEL